ncbi:MAG: DUF1893 domain-containing protein [Bacteroidales bacterium]
MKQLINLLHEGNYSCVIQNGTDLRTFTRRGVIDIYELLHHDAGFLHGASLADKVIGKGAAALMIQGGVTHVYAGVISKPALELLQTHNVQVDYLECVEGIINRERTGSCPLEQICLVSDSVSELMPLITGFISTMRQRCNPA